MIINKHTKYEKHFEEDQQTIKTFDTVYRKNLQDNVIDKNEFKFPCNKFNEDVDEVKNVSFL